MLAYLWHWFIQLNNTRQAGLSMSAICNQEIKAFCELHGLHMSQFELSAIAALDRIAINASREE